MFLYIMQCTDCFVHCDKGVNDNGDNSTAYTYTCDDVVMVIMNGTFLTVASAASGWRRRRWRCGGGGVGGEGDIGGQSSSVVSRQPASQTTLRIAVVSQAFTLFLIFFSRMFATRLSAYTRSA